MAVAELGDARRLARVRDLVDGLGARGVEHQLVGGRRRGQGGGNALRNGRGQEPHAGEADVLLRAPLLSAAASASAMSSAPTTRACGHASAARSASQAGVTMSVVAPSLRRTAAAGPSDLKPVSTVTGFGFSMKCAPSCSATTASSFASRMRARMSARRSLKFMSTSLSRSSGEERRRRVSTMEAAPSSSARFARPQDEARVNAEQTSSDPAASPRSVSSNNSSSGRCFEIMPCWCT